MSKDKVEKSNDVVTWREWLGSLDRHDLRAGVQEFIDIFIAGFNGVNDIIAGATISDDGGRALARWAMTKLNLEGAKKVNDWFRAHPDIEYDITTEGFRYTGRVTPEEVTAAATVLEEKLPRELKPVFKKVIAEAKNDPAAVAAEASSPDPSERTNNINPFNPFEQRIPFTLDGNRGYFGGRPIPAESSILGFVQPVRYGIDVSSPKEIRDAYEPARLAARVSIRQPYSGLNPSFNHAGF